MDFHLDFDTWDIPIAGGLLREVTDAMREKQQRVAIALKTFLGESSRNTTVGLPWREEILIKGPNLNHVQSRIRAYLASIEGITSVLALGVVLDEHTRSMTITPHLETTEGEIPPFNVRVRL